MSSCKHCHSFVRYPSLTVMCRARDSLFSAVHPLLKFIGRYSGCYVTLLASGASTEEDGKAYFSTYVALRSLPVYSTNIPLAVSITSLKTGRGGKIGPSTMKRRSRVESRARLSSIFIGWVRSPAIYFIYNHSWEFLRGL